ncbi:MAG: hypothetical protein MRZ77_00405 [Clostridiales bacterium]|nr:hypothetical protein [Clostridiales bacterium]MDD6390546.1 CarD family transcriptional regulator [Bacillota bacterium]MDY5975226.1 CarD family transcriptional regulator [Anaerovoracaceae bacterium]
MFRIGDLIFYSKTGVCEIVEIIEKESEAFGRKNYYILRPLYQECDISIPVDNKKVYMRPVISREKVDELIDAIPEMDAQAYYSQNLNQLKEHYRQLMDTHSCEDMIRVSKSVRNKQREVEANKRKLGAVDERFMKEAEDLLFGEFAAVLEISKADVPGYIEDRLNRH